MAKLIKSTFFLRSSTIEDRLDSLFTSSSNCAEDLLLADLPPASLDTFSSVLIMELRLDSVLLSSTYITFDEVALSTYFAKKMLLLPF